MQNNWSTQKLGISISKAKALALKDKEAMDKFYKKHWLSNVGNEEITIILKSHLYIENLIDEILSYVLPNPQKILNYKPQKTANCRVLKRVPTMSLYKFSTKLSNFQAFDIAERLMKEFLMDIACRIFEFVDASGINEAGWQNQQFGANRLKRRRPPSDRQAQKLEPVDQIVAQKNQMEIDLIGQKAVGRNIAQGEAFFEFSDVQFASGSWSVKMPYPLCAQRKIGNKSVIKIVLELPERKLIFFFFGFGLGTANHNETMRLLPIVRLIGKLSHLPAVLSEGMVTKALNLFLNRGSHFGYHHVTDVFLVERLDELVVVEPRIGTDANTVEILRYFLFDCRPQRLSSGSGMGISRTQKTMPDIPAVSLEADQGMITGASGFGRIVADFGSLYFPAEDRQDGRIQIENKTAGDSCYSLNRIAQRIVQPPDVFGFLHYQTLQEIPQGRTARKVFQSQECLEVSVVMQNSGIRDSLHSCHHCVNYSQNQLGRVILTAAPFPANVVLQVSLQIQFSAKLLKKNHTAIVGQTRILDGKTYLSNASEHTSISSLTVRLMKWTLLNPDYNSFPSPLLTFLSLKHGNSPLIQDKFSSKVDMFEVLNITPSKLIIEKIREVNKIRNAFSHNLNEKLLKSDLGVLIKGIKIKKDGSSIVKLRAVFMYIIGYLHAFRTICKLFPFAILFSAYKENFKKDKGIRIDQIKNIYPTKEVGEILESMRL